MTNRTITVASYDRKVTLSKVNWSCVWCGRNFSDERFPGSFLPKLCKICYPEYRSWQRANYYREKNGLEPLNVLDWIDRQRANGKIIPDVLGELSNRRIGFNIGRILHAPENNAITPKR